MTSFSVCDGCGAATELSACRKCGAPTRGVLDLPIGYNVPQVRPFRESCEHVGVRTPVEGACGVGIIIVCAECGQEVV